MGDFYQGADALSTLFEPKTQIAYGTFKIGRYINADYPNSIGEDTWSPTNNITVTQSQSWLETSGTSYFRIVTAGTYKLQFIFRFLRWRGDGNGDINIHLGSSSTAGGNSCPHITDIYSMQVSGASNSVQYGTVFINPNNDDNSNAQYYFRAGMNNVVSDSNLLSVDITFTASASYDIYPAARYEEGSTNPIVSMYNSKWMITKLF